MEETDVGQEKDVWGLDMGVGPPAFDIPSGPAMSETPDAVPVEIAMQDAGPVVNDPETQRLTVRFTIILLLIAVSLAVGLYLLDTAG